VEIFSYLRTQDLLALARTSKPFCHTLVASESESLWRQARQRCLPDPLPDPNEILLGSNEQEEARATESTDFMDLILGFIHPILLPNVEEEQEVAPPVPTAENVEIAPVADVAVIPGAAVLTTNVEMQEAAEEPPAPTTENVETAPAAGVPVLQY
jgi:hypothetical protein